MAATILHTVLKNDVRSAYLYVRGRLIEPTGSTLFDPGARVEVMPKTNGTYSVRRPASDLLHSLTEEIWRASV